MAIPEGYRLLTSADVGKTFGVDLESMVYFDEDITPTFYLTSNGDLNLTNFCKERRDYLPVAEEEVSSGIYLYGNTNAYIYYEVGGVSFYPAEADLSGVEITSFNTDYNWNNWLYVKDKSDIYDKTVTNTDFTVKCAGKKMTKDLKIKVDVEVLNPQEKTVTPTKSIQELTPDSDYNGLSKVTINAIPDNYIEPSGTLEVTENGSFDITEKASVNVNVPTGVDEEALYTSLNEMTFGAGYTLTLNCDSDILNDSNYTYSLDSGTTWNQFTSEVMTFNTEKIRFAGNNVGGIGGYGYYVSVGTSEGYSDIGMFQTPTTDLSVSSGTIWYVSGYYNSGGAD